MARRTILVALVAACAAAWPASSFAATAPAAAPTLSSVVFVAPATFTWTPGVSPDPLAPNLGQRIIRSAGLCPGAVGTAQQVGPDLAANAGSHTTSPTIADGVYCFHVRAFDLLGTADGPGLTVVIDQDSPTGSVAVAPVAPGNVLTGVVTVSGTSADTASGVASSVFHVGAAGSCGSGAVIPSTWDTTTVPNGSYTVCNVVIDNAGHVAVFAVPVTVANPVAPPPPPPVVGAPSGVVSSAPPVVAPSVPADTTAPKPPTRLSVILPRAKASTGTVPVTLRWVKPTASDLARVVVVLNLRHAPHSPSNGSTIYHGLGSSAVLKLAAGGTGYVALFAYDHSGNVSKPAQKVVSLAPLIPLRPFTGSTVTTAPRLTWTSQKATAYYNVQLFRNGTRVLTGWPSQAAFTIPAGKLKPGTYVWFVWPAIRHATGAPTFGTLIGRATFVYKGL
jgi:hypothetical protein